MEVILIENGDQIPASFGPPRQAVRKSTVAVREPAGVETFEKSWGRLTATPGVDLVIRHDDGDEYPIKRDIFATNYQQVSPGCFRKTARSKLVRCPEGVTVVLKTLEGEMTVRHPDFIVVGQKNEVYANSPQWVAENLEFVS
jgi:hypothetical protein